MNKSKLGVYALIIGLILVVIDSIIYGEYTGVPHTIFGFVGCVLMCIVMVIMIFAE